MKNIAISCLFTLFSFSELYASWFPETILEKTYTALMKNNIPLAWQELQIALSREPIDQKYWLSVKEAILSKTDCGRDLGNSIELPGRISISFIRKSDLINLGYQIKISAELVTEEFNIVLLDPNGKQLLEAYFGIEDDYVEFESKDLIEKPVYGLYQLVVNNKNIPLIISGISEQKWLKLDDTNTISPLHLSVNLPENIIACTPATAYWQWFDSNYNMLNQHRILANSTLNGRQYTVRLPQLQEATPQQVERLSAVASQYEYQSGIKINYIQRTLLPIPGSRFSHL
jgi:hypothetical protein